MMTSKIGTKARKFGNEVLARRYSKLQTIGGQGIQRGTRVRFIDENGATVRCAIKVATNSMGRISFPHSGGSWGALGDVECVLLVRTARDRPNAFEAIMFSKDVILKAFTRNREAAEENGFASSLPWLGADHESQVRYTGSGFGSDALWSEFSGPAEPSLTPTPPIGMSELLEPLPELDDDDLPSLPALPAVAAAIAKAKATIAAELGVRVTAIAINVRL